jgi:hypothetical protein
MDLFKNLAPRELIFILKHELYYQWKEGDIL